MVQPGDVEDGFEFKGGDPKDKNNWTKVSAAKSLAGGAAGAAYGVVQTLNPLNAPQGLEVLARAPFVEVDKQKSFLEQTGERFRKAQEASVIPNVEEVAAGIRTAGNVLTSGKMPTWEAFTDEYAAQKEKQLRGPATRIPGFATGQMVGEVGTAAAQLGPLALKAAGAVPKTIPGIKGFLGKIKDLKNAAIEEASLGKKSVTKAVEAKQLAQDLLGEVAPEVGEALWKKTEAVESALKGGREAQSLFPEVKALRSHIDESEQMVGQAVGAWRDFIKSTSDVRINTSGMTKDLTSLANRMKTEAGISTLSQADQYLIAKYKFMLSAPKKVRELAKADIIESGSFDEIMEQLTPQQKASFLRSLIQDIPEEAIRNTKDIPISDALKISDAADVDLKRFYAGSPMGNPSREVSATISAMRNNIKGDLHKKFPDYAVADEAFTLLKNNGDQIRGKIEGTGAESFLSNLFGVNKSEQRALLEEWIQNAKLASAAIGRSGGARSSGSDAAKILLDASTKIDSMDAKKFLESVATKLAARNLSKAVSSGQTDFVADRIARLTRQYAENAAKIAETRAGTTGGTLFGLLGTGVGGATGFLVGSPGGILGQAGAALGGAAFGGSQGYKLGYRLVGKPAGLLARVRAEKEAEALYTPFALLEKIKEAKTASESSKKIANDVLTVRSILGDEDAAQFMKLIPVSKDLTADLLKAGWRSGGAAGALVPNDYRQIEGE